MTTFIEGHVTVWVVVPVFSGGWLLMLLAVMIPPELVPIGRSGMPSPAAVAETPSDAVVWVGFFAAWMAFGLNALAFDSRVHATVDAVPWLTSRPQLVSGGAFVIAGLFELSPVKSACLRLDSRLRQRVGEAGNLTRRAALTVGVHQATAAMASCWALMLVALAVGMASLAWMAILTAVMVAERLLHDSRRLRVAIGTALLVVGAVTAAPNLGIVGH